MVRSPSRSLYDHSLTRWSGISERSSRTVASGGLVASVEDISDVVDLLGPRGGAAGGGAQVDVPEPGGDGVHGHAGLEAVSGPVGA